MWYIFIVIGYDCKHLKIMIIASIIINFWSSIFEAGTKENKIYKLRNHYNN